jgi:hypothetical protein
MLVQDGYLYLIRTRHKLTVHLSRELGDDDLCKCSMMIILWHVRDGSHMCIRRCKMSFAIPSVVISNLWPAQDTRITICGKMFVK